MIKSGFSGYKSKSARVLGRKNIADSYASLDSAIKSIVGNENTQIFTTLAPQTLVLDSSNNVSRWNPLGYSNANCFLTKSGNTPTYDTTYKLGKFGGVRSVSNQGLVQNTAEDSASFNKTFLFYMRVNTFGGFSSPEVLFSHSWNNTVGQCTTSRFATYNNANFTIYNSATSSIAAIKLAYLNGAASVYSPASTNIFRTLESRILSNRTGSQGFYDGNKNLIPTPTGPFGTLTTSTSSYTFSPSSMGLTNAEWDGHYTNGFLPSKLFVLSNATDSLFFTLIYVPSTLTATQVQRTKLLLDKLYGV